MSVASSRAGRVRRIVTGVLLVVFVGGCGNATPTPSPAPTAAATATSSPTATPIPTPTPSPTVTPPVTFPIAVVVRYDDARTAVTPEALAADIRAGTVVVPCEVTSLTLNKTALTIPPATACKPAADITASVHDKKTPMALLPPGLVTPSIKVLAVGTADLFGSPSHRTVAYPLTAVAAVDPAWAFYSEGAVRTLISTGDTCPDRGVSYMANTVRKGWDWVLSGGTAQYGGLKTTDLGWPAPIIARRNTNGAVAALISDNDISANDFECPVVKDAIQHNTGMVFEVDPRAVTLLAGKGGVKVVTLGSNHITDGGKAGVLSTVAYLDQAGIKHTGAGATLADALAPAVVNVRGIKFAFVGWDDITGSAAATDAHPGVAPMTDANVCNSIKAARKVADVVIAMPQWGWPEYHNDITPEQVAHRQMFYDCGADGVLGSGTHWASWASILPGPNGPRFAIGSHGNFLFDQSWSRQTMEGVIVEVTFVGTRLAQFRLHPYVIVQGAQPCLVDPAADGAYVLHQVWSASNIQ